MSCIPCPADLPWNETLSFLHFSLVYIPIAYSYAHVNLISGKLD